MKKLSKIRYRLYCLNPKTKKWNVAEQGKTLEKVGKKIGMNLMFNKDYYTNGNGKKLKLRLVSEEVIGKNIKELEEYKITKDWKIKGYFGNWEKM